MFAYMYEYIYIYIYIGSRRPEDRNKLLQERREERQHNNNRGARVNTWGVASPEREGMCASTTPLAI